MTKEDKVELIDRISHESHDFNDWINNPVNKMLSKMEVNYRGLVEVTITSIATTATIVELIS